MLALAFSLFAFSTLAHTLSRRLDPHGSTALTIALLFTLMIGSVEVLGIFEAFTSNNLLLLSALALGGGLFLRDKSKAPHQSAGVLFLTLGLLATLPAFIPSGETDTLGYHLPIVNALIETGSVWEVFFAGFVGPNTYFPANHEALQAFLAVFTQNTEAGFFVNLSGLALFFFSLKESLGQKRSPAPLLFVLLAACTPFLFKQVLNQQLDLFLFSLFGSALAFLCSSHLERKKVDFSKACLLLGLCLGTKYNALPQVLVLLPFMGALALHQKHRLKDHALNLGLTLSAGLFWYVRNAVLTGNPLYPFGLSVGPLHWIGHRTFVQETQGTSLLAHLQSDGLSATLQHVLGNAEFTNELGKTALVLAGGTALLLLLKTLLSRRGPQRVLGLSVLLVAAGELFYYLSAPYTFTLWNQTIRYASPLFALVPVALMFLASSHKKRAILSVASLFLIIEQLGNGFLSKDHVQTLLGEANPWLLILPFLLGGVFALFSLIRPNKLRFALFSLAFSLCAVTLVPVFKTPGGEASTPAEDAYLSVDLPGYEKLLPVLEVLRAEPKGEVALTGLTPYALFDKEGFPSHYISIDGCLTCTYPDYRSEAASIRTAPDEAAWKTALENEGITYLLVSTAYEPAIVMHEKTWADADPEHFELLYKEGELSLYRLR